MKNEFWVIIEKGEDGYYIGTVPELKGCHTQGKTLDELMENIREAIALCIEIEDEEDETLELVGIQRIAV
ncbi:MAG: type II toxin-antitoxin system HicB family antitoxin [Deltaproteobacteria bacterium]|nr:type II toxin-antitoxin system HicB family antitoxin [Deltaproteobacteria bacterium]